MLASIRQSSHHRHLQMDTELTARTVSQTFISNIKLSNTAGQIASKKDSAIEDTFYFELLGVFSLDMIPKLKKFS